MWTVAGACPKCGAPIYVPTVWHAVTPPPPHYTCGCNPQPRVYTSATTRSAEAS